MRYAKDRKSKTRRKIVESAYRLFTSKGYTATSIDEIMRDCGLTHGGFYAHFKSKSQLYHEAINHAASLGELLAARVGEGERKSPIESMIDEYLNADEISSGDRASRLAFFATDVARRESEVRSAYTEAFKSISEKILVGAATRFACSEASILSITAMIVGALAIAQTTDDVVLKRKLLAACRENAKALLEDAHEYRSLNFFWATSAAA